MTRIPKPPYRTRLELTSANRTCVPRATGQVYRLPTTLPTVDHYPCKHAPEVTSLRLCARVDSNAYNRRCPITSIAVIVTTCLRNLRVSLDTIRGNYLDQLKHVRTCAHVCTVTATNLQRLVIRMFYLFLLLFVLSLGMSHSRRDRREPRMVNKARSCIYKGCFSLSLLFPFFPFLFTQQLENKEYSQPRLVLSLVGAQPCPSQA